MFQTLSVEVGDNGREEYEKNVDEFMEQVGYTKVVNLCCSAHALDNIYVRNDFRSLVFEGGGNPRLLNNMVVRKLTNLLH